MSAMWWMRPARLLRQVNTRACTTEALEGLTGIQKKELQAHLSGDYDPFRVQAIKKGPGTRDQPNLIPSAFSYRHVACLCNPWETHLNYMVLHAGHPKRCECGHWFELYPVQPFV